MSDKYILVGKKPTPVAALMEWANWFEMANRRVALDVVGEARISTCFLGLNHQFGGGPPILFETMVFGGTLDGEQERCSTWEQALAQHAEMLQRVQGEPQDA